MAWTKPALHWLTPFGPHKRGDMLQEQNTDGGRWLQDWSMQQLHRSGTKQGRIQYNNHLLKVAAAVNGSSSSSSNNGSSRSSTVNISSNQGGVHSALIRSQADSMWINA